MCHDCRSKHAITYVRKIRHNINRIDFCVHKYVIALKNYINNNLTEISRNRVLFNMIVNAFYSKSQDVFPPGFFSLGPLFSNEHFYNKIHIIFVIKMTIVHEGCTVFVYRTPWRIERGRGWGSCPRAPPRGGGRQNPAKEFLKFL